MLSIKIDPVERVTAVSVRNDLSLPAQRAALAAFVRDGIAVADQTNRMVLGRVPPRTITVDGRLGAALDSVEPDGGSVIVEYELVGDVLQWIGQTLVDRSPVTSGAYKKGHTLFADGSEVAAGAQIPPAAEYVFINLVPYARRLEVGKTETGRDFLIQAPNHIYERTAKDAAARFGNVADIQFAYRQAVGAYALKHDQPSRSFKGGRLYIAPTIRKDRVAGAAVTPPAIIVKLRNS